MMIVIPVGAHFILRIGGFVEYEIDGQGALMNAEYFIATGHS
jgi:hypothetical protein